MLINKSWGYYNILAEPTLKTKIKTLHVKPGSSLSLQRHFQRSEYWFVLKGLAGLETADTLGNLQINYYKEHSHIHIPVYTWHRLFNDTNSEIEILEIQYGNKCIEEDIERKL